MSHPLGAACLAMLAMLNLWAFASVGYWDYLVAPALMAAMAFSLMGAPKSRGLLLLGLLGCGVLAAVTRTYFFDGARISAEGLVVGLLPSAVVAIIVGLKIWSFELRIGEA